MWYLNNEPALVNLDKFVHIYIEKLGERYMVWGKTSNGLTQIKIEAFDNEKKAEDFVKRMADVTYLNFS
jgi:hypothetical protein